MGFLRNWKVLVGLAVVLVLLLIGGFIFGVLGLLKSSDAYRLAVAHASADPQVRLLLGESIQAGFASGSINKTGAETHAKLSIPLTGSRGTGTLLVDATKTGGVMTFDELRLVDPAGHAIDLREGMNARLAAETIPLPAE